jgi:hypothetical protein
MTSSGYRNRTVDAQQQAADAASPSPPARAAPQAGSTESAPAYRSGGGMSQALERNRAAAQPRAEARTTPGTARTNPSSARTSPAVSPRAYDRSTGMPRESTRAPAPRETAPAMRAPSHGGGAGAQRGEAGGGYRGGSGGGDGGGGQRAPHAAARGAR